MTCTCGAAADFTACCGPRLAGERQAATAEELMRTRYSAYVRCDLDFLYESQAPEGRDDFDRDAAEQWSRQADWQGLEVLRTEGGGPDDSEGTVEFVARYRIGDEDVTHHEIATFRRGEGRWLFVDGHPPRQEPFRRQTPKVGPNEPCPCGSGKKHKKCCGARR